MSFPLILEKIWADYTYSSKKANLSHSRYVLYAWGCVDVFIYLQIWCRNRIYFNLFLELQSQKRAADAHDHWCKYISFAVLPGYASAIFNCWWTDCSDISSWSFGLMADQTEAFCSDHYWTVLCSDHYWTVLLTQWSLCPPFSSITNGQYSKCSQYTVWSQKKCGNYELNCISSWSQYICLRAIFDEVLFYFTGTAFKLCVDWTWSYQAKLEIGSDWPPCQAQYF